MLYKTVDNLDLSKYEDKTILIVGGGTSTLDKRWDNLPHDYLWTTNQFYLQYRLLRKKVDLVTIGENVDLSNKTFIGKVKSDKPTCIVEPSQSSTVGPTLNNFCKETEVEVLRYDIRLPEGVYKTDVCMRAGAAFRLILLAMQTKAKEILFVGFDGHTKEYDNPHAFTGRLEPSKRQKAATYDKRDISIVNRFRSAYNVLSRLPGFHRLQNLGEGMKYNLGSEISSKFFPLNKKYKEVIDG